jgi:DNA-directed RNA polymerase specialized sigma subunit
MATLFSTDLSPALLDKIFDFPDCFVEKELRSDMISQIENRLLTLSLLQQQIIHLRFTENKSVREIAFVLSYSESFIGSKMRQAVHYLRMEGNYEYRKRMKVNYKS